MVVLRYLDVALVVLAAVPALVLGAPAVCYAIGAGGYVLQRVIAANDRRWVSKAGTPQHQFAMELFARFGRIWLMAGAIIAAGLIARANGLTAALVIFGAYSVAFVIRVSSGPPQRRSTS